MQENCVALHGGAGYGVIAGLGIQPTFTLTSSIYQNKLQSAAFKSGITLTAMVSLTPKLVFLPDGSVGLRHSFWSLDLSTHSTCWALCSEAQVSSNTCLQHTPRQYLELLDSRAPLTQTGVATGFPFFQKVDSLVTLRI